MIGIAALAGCQGDDGGGSDDTSVQGRAVYRDAETSAGGAPRDPTPPPAQSMEVDVRIAGSGSLSGLEGPECTLDGANGSFHGLFAGTAQLDQDGLFIAGMSQSEAVFTTPTAACEIPEVSIATLTEVAIVAKLQNTTPNCSTYCAAKARSHAEAECSASADEAACRAAAEADYAVSCETACTGSTTRRITAEIVIDATTHAALLADLNARSLGVGGLGVIDIDLTFDRVREDRGDGAIVDEAP